MRRPIVPFSRLVGLLLLLTLSAGAIPVRETPAWRLPAGPEESSSRDQRDELCYHAPAYYYIKVPHPTWGSMGRMYQRISPVDAGHLTGMELRLHNNYEAGNSHHGELRLGVHRLAGQWPCPAEQSWTFASDSLSNGVFYFELPGSEFHFSQGEEFLISLDYLPATAQDTIAIVAAETGSWTGHSFFLSGSEFLWWGDNQGNIYGDMHFCAEVDWTNGPRPFAWLPQQDLDLGLFAPGEHKDLALPILNSGT
ncbi:MAG: hypothetical protein KC518_13580, partial [Candidatus Cloacimonetes bacterium]|nr:hypothetical protein [Candidatus Cloacimonadota bacterium]